MNVNDADIDQRPPIIDVANGTCEHDEPNIPPSTGDIQMVNDEQAARAPSVDVIEDSLDADSDEILFVRPKPTPQCARSPLSVVDSLDDVCPPSPRTPTHAQQQPTVTTNAIGRNTAVRLFDARHCSRSA